MISVKGVGKRFDNSWIFRNISLSIEEGRTAALIGPSGGGKSLLLKIIAGLAKPEEGCVKLDSSNIGMLFQKNALFDSLTVEENLLFPLKERKGTVGLAARKKALKILEEVGLTGCEAHYPDEISGGMQKRLGIARALIVEPEIILYDEPTAGLDPITSKKIAELIQKLRSEIGSTVLTVTNDMQRAYQLGDSIYLLAQGSLMAGGSPDDVKASSHPGIRQFIYGLKEGPLTSGLA
jgi:phospholipid/cholesterol/gamma-HCH transport system ATP-binding protein